MTREQLEERIAKAEAKVEKKLGTIEKHKKTIGKYQKEIENIKNGTAKKRTYEYYDDETQIRFLEGDINYKEDDIKRNESEIEETRKTIEKYKNQLQGVVEKEAEFDELPEAVKRMEEEIIKSWDESDARTRQYYCDTYNQYKAEEDKARKECEEQGMSWVAVNKYIRVNELDAYHRFIKKFKYTAYDFMRITDEEIHKANVKDAHRLILNFIQRVKERIGTITDYSNLGTATSSSGTMLTGYICGTEGRVRIESILAGGYNIQRLHVRILIHEM